MVKRNNAPIKAKDRPNLVISVCALNILKTGKTNTKMTLHS